MKVKHVFGGKVMKRTAVAVLLSLALVSLVSCGGGGGSSSPTAVVPLWAKTYGGANWDGAFSIQQTSDGGYIVAGYTGSFGASNNDFWVLKLDSDGAVVWQKTYGGASDDVATSIQQTSDGGYIVAGYTKSFGAGNYDYWVLKLKSNGDVEWQNAYGGTGNDYAYSIQQTSDGSYIVAGYTYSFGAGGDYWVLKLNSDGAVVWNKAYGGTSNDYAYSIQQTSDRGYIVAGYTNVGASNYDFWVLKLDSDGTVAWQKTYGGTSDDVAYSIQQTSDGNYIVAGYTNSFGAGNNDFWVLKLDSDGTVAWQKTYGGTSNDFAYSIQQTSDGGYIVAGETYSFGAGNKDFWVLKLDSFGTVAWQKTYGGANWDYANSIQQTRDGGYIVAGYTYSFGAGGYDYWVLKLNSDGGIVFNSASGASTTDTSVIPSGTSVSFRDSGVTPSEPTVTKTQTFVQPQDTDAMIVQQAP